MKSTDTNPRTKDLNAKIHQCTIRILYADDSHYDYKLDHNYTGPRSAHPYIDKFLENTNVKQIQKILVLNPDGSERLGPIIIPTGKLPVFRIRTRFGGVVGVQKFIIIGIVDKNSQTLHYLDIHGKSTVNASPPELGPQGKIQLFEEELARL